MTKDTYKYHVKIGQKVIDRGFCRNLLEKENEYKIKYPDCHLDQIGRVCLYKTAIKWLHDGGKRDYRKTYRHNPNYLYDMRNKRIYKS